MGLTSHPRLLPRRLLRLIHRLPRLGCKPYIQRAASARRMNECPRRALVEGGMGLTLRLLPLPLRGRLGRDGCVSGAKVRKAARQASYRLLKHTARRPS